MALEMVVHFWVNHMGMVYYGVDLKKGHHKQVMTYLKIDQTNWLNVLLNSETTDW
jgi:hypothetical protein